MPLFSQGLRALNLKEDETIIFSCIKIFSFVTKSTVSDTFNDQEGLLNFLFLAFNSRILFSRSNSA